MDMQLTCDVHTRSPRQYHCDLRKHHGFLPREATAQLRCALIPCCPSCLGSILSCTVRTDSVYSVTNLALWAMQAKVTLQSAWVWAWASGYRCSSPPCSACYLSDDEGSASPTSFLSSLR